MPIAPVPAPLAPAGLPVAPEAEVAEVEAPSTLYDQAQERCWSFPLISIYVSLVVRKVILHRVLQGLAEY